MFTNKEIREHNPHFQGEIIKYPIGFMDVTIKPYKIFGTNRIQPEQKYRFFQEIGCTGNRYRACYIYDINTRNWTLGAN